jgi:exopolysaccharide biosynthesis polyprenyl glycosylphosphotransferase
MAFAATQIEPIPKSVSAPSAPQSESRSHARRHWADYITAAAFLGDTASVLCGLVAGFWIRFNSGWITFGVESQARSLSAYFTPFCLGLLFFYLTFSRLGFYEPGTVFRFRRGALTIARGTVFWVLTYLGTSLVLKFEPPISRIYALCSFFCIFGLLLAWRGILSRIVQSEAFARQLRRRMLIVGWTEDVGRLLRAIEKETTRFYEVIGYVPLASGNGHTGLPRMAALGSFDDIEVLLQEHQPEMVVLADNNLDQAQIIGLVNLCEKRFVDFKKIPSYFQILVSGLQLELVNGIPMLGIVALPLDRLAHRIIKRTVDVLGSIAGLILSAPVILFCGVCVYAESPGPIFFAQERLAHKGKRFRMFKMRTMKPGSERLDHLNQSTLRDDPRLLKIGKWMRHWNIDETPQFWNVLKGDMSLVGPRPERVSHSLRLSEEIPHYNARYTCKPGMTGWAQVNGFRGDTSLAERVRYDLFYLEHWNLRLDFQIMIQTFYRRQNAY